MPYFEQHYNSVRFPIDEEKSHGLRRAQLGAIHAIASHFTLRNEPALLVLPTGSGKTAVLILSAFLERANRVLVVAPSRLVRTQIRDEFGNLRVPKSIGALPKEIADPKVKEIKKESQPLRSGMS